MEEEYRAQKAATETPAATPVIHEDGTVSYGESSALAAKDADDDASTKGVMSTAGTPLHSPKNSTKNGTGGNDPDVDAITNGIPTIRISTESNRERSKTGEATTNGTETNGDQPPESNLEKPVQAADATQDTTTESGTSAAQQEAFSFTNKRLCERWLDNLFMVLYEVQLFYLLVRFCTHCCFTGSSCMDNLPCRSRTFQDTACGVPQDRHGVGDPR